MAMFGGAAVPSLADIAAVTRNNDGDGFGGNNGWWILIILFALFGGWGNGGYGNGGYNQGTQAEVQRGFDTQAIIGKLDGLANGICDLGFAIQGQTNTLGTQVMQGNFGLQQAINGVAVGAMQNANALQAQLSECCCENRAAIAQVRYDMATDTCAIKNEVHQTGDAIIQNQNQGFQMLNNTIRDGFCALEMREMQRENQALRDQLNNCNRDSALQGTASYIINSVRPTPLPSWNVPNPWAGCNCNTGCGCGGCNTGCC